MESKDKNLEDFDFDGKMKTISNLGIYELRAVARGIGIQSPTTKKRDELIFLIADILKNNSIEIPHGVSKGRPVKKLENMDNILNVISDNSMKNFEIPKTYSYEDLIVFAQEIPIFEYHSTEALKMTGVLRIVKRSAYFLDNENGLIVFVSNENIERLYLENGDYLEVMAYKINNLNQYSAKQILTVNGTLLDDYFLLKPKCKNRVLPTKTAKIDDMEVVLGGKNIKIIDSPLFLDMQVKAILDKFDNSDNEVVFLGANIIFEDNMFLKSFKNAIIFTTNYEISNLTKDFNNIVDCINYCERLIALNKNVVLCLFDLVNILNALDLYFSVADGVKNQEHFQQSLVIIKRLLGLSSAYSVGTTSTSIIFCNQVDEDDCFIKNEVVKVSKKI